MFQILPVQGGEDIQRQHDSRHLRKRATETNAKQTQSDSSRLLGPRQVMALHQVNIFYIST